MKATLLAFSLAAALSGLSSAAHAAIVTGGGYTATDSTPFQWEELGTPSKTPVAGATRVLGNHDDSATGLINLGFNFSFFNQTYSQVQITSNGLLTFGGTTTNNSNMDLGQALPFSTMPMIAVAWDDWTTTYSGTDGVYYKTQGAPGSQSFTVEWRNTKKYDTASNSNSSPVSFEAVLYEGSNSIDFRYIDMETGGSLVNPDASLGATATVGIRDVDAHLNGRYLQWSNNQAVLTNNSVVRITTVAAPVPEPETYGMLLAGLGLMGFASRRRRPASNITL
ncbi:MAG: PEP-CTERM sorting domain-containing protein [Nitrosomonadales bacterium]|nr:PEP-CTERM sorting domain-containing protein [Nitrosomonadales bacterium]